jgi:hypothetical protein
MYSLGSKPQDVSNTTQLSARQPYRHVPAGAGGGLPVTQAALLVHCHIMPHHALQVSDKPLHGSMQTADTQLAFSTSIQAGFPLQAHLLRLLHMAHCVT